LAKEQRRIIYKKIDSTLQGNIGPEVEAILEECGYSLALVAPAFPSMGRTIVEGWLQVASQAVPKPIHLPNLLREQGLANVVHFTRSSLADGYRVLVEQLKEVADSSRTVTAFDSSTPQDLEVIAQAGAELGAQVLPVGSAGLAREVAKILAQKNQRLPKHAPVGKGGETILGAVVVVVGSMNLVTTRQVEFLVANRPASLVACRSNNLETTRKALSEKGHLVVKLDFPVTDSQHLATLLTILSEESVHGVILSGGDTADLVCRALRATGIQLESEIVPGIPWGRLRGGVANGLAVATKAGGFGSEEALVTLTDFLAAQESL
jgi:uncharacterized protein YgbK (DUF1537 family)